MVDFAENCVKPKMGRHPSPFITSRAARNSVLRKYIEQAEQRGHVWVLSPETFDSLTSQNCHYCGQTPSNTARASRKRSVFTYNGIDRKDNNRGYTSDNVVPCCKTCNILKGRMSYAEFIGYLDRVTEFRRLKANVVGA